MISKSALLKKNYTLNDIFIRNNSFLFLIPPLIFFTTPLSEFILASVYFDEHPFSFDFTYPAVLYAAVFFSAVIFIVSLICFAIKNKEKKVRNPLRRSEVYLFALFSVLAISTTMAGSFQSMGTKVFGGLYYVLAEFLVFFMCSIFIEKKTFKKFLIYSYLVLSIILALTELFDQLIKGIPIYRIDTCITAVFYSPNYYGYFMLMAIILSASLLSFESSKKEKIFLIISFFINSIVFAMANCLGTFLACIAGFAFLFIGLSIRNKKIAIKPVILFASFMLICFLVGLKYQSFFSDVVYLFKDVKMIAEDSENAGSAGTGRWAIWMATIELIKQKPLFGWGASGINFELFDRVGINAAHNEYMQYAADYGIPAALIYISGLVCIFIRAWKNRRTMDEMSIACLVASFAYIVSAMFGNNISFVGPFYYIFLGLAVNYEKSEKPTAV